MINRRHLNFRENARLANICLSQKDYAEAFKHACLALAASPEAFLKRILYELRTQATVINGNDPRQFRDKKDLLWPTGRPCLDSERQVLWANNLPNAPVRHSCL